MRPASVALFVDDVSQIKNGREISPAIPAGRRYLYEPVTPIDRAPLERSSHEGRSSIAVLGVRRTRAARRLSMWLRIRSACLHNASVIRMARWLCDFSPARGFAAKSHKIRVVEPRVGPVSDLSREFSFVRCVHR